MATQIYTATQAKEHQESVHREALELLDKTLAIHIGPRVKAELQRRVRELENRCPKAITMNDRRELAARRDLLQLSRKEMDQ